MDPVIATVHATKNAEDWISISDEVYRITQFHNMIGAVNSKRVRIICRYYPGLEFFYYKKIFSFVVMAWTDADYKFIFIDVTAYGSSGDSQIFKDSMIGKSLQQNQLTVLKGRMWNVE